MGASVYFAKETGGAFDHWGIRLGRIRVEKGSWRLRDGLGSDKYPKLWKLVVNCFFLLVFTLL